MRMMKKSKSLLLALLFATIAGQSMAQQNIDFEEATVAFDSKTLTVEFASSQKQRAMGLMFRKQLCDDCGMLFRFSPARHASMWMKNTYVPLDVAFIDKMGVITDIKPLQPHDLTSVGSSKAVTHALEMNQGWFAEHDIHVGDHMTVNP